MSSAMTERLRSSPISMPPSAEPIRVTAMMPMITPRAVRIERILWARICEEAIRKLSTSSMAVSEKGMWNFKSALSLFLDLHFRAVLQLAADGGIASGHDFLAGLDARFALDGAGVG